MAVKEYSCVKKTKAEFENSLIELSKTYPLNKITIKMLCEHAQLSRNTFYFHYADINDLLSDMEDSIINGALSNFDLFREMGFPKNVRATVVSLIDLIDEKRDVCKMLMTYSDSFVTKISLSFCDFFYPYFEEYHGADTTNRDRYDFFYMFLSNGFFSLLKYWLDNPDKIKKSELIGLNYLLVKRLLMPINPEIDFNKKSE